jgi:hypothetical protein
VVGGDGGAVAQADAEAPVLIVGDSLSVGATPYIRRDLAPLPVDLDARTGRATPEGVRVLASELDPSHRVVVFDLATNNSPSQPEALAADLASVRALAADRCLVVATVSRPPVGGTSVDGLNGVLRDFVQTTPGAQLVEWHEATESQRGLLGSDGVHPTSAGHELRGIMMADAVATCLASKLEEPLEPEPAPEPESEAPPPEPDPLPETEPPAPGPPLGLPALAELAPVRTALAVLTTAAVDVIEALAEIRDAVVGSEAEPVLGGR